VTLPQDNESNFELNLNENKFTHQNSFAIIFPIICDHNEDAKTGGIEKNAQKAKNWLDVENEDATELNE
jgi:hypothetical protein